MKVFSRASYHLISRSRECFLHEFLTDLFEALLFRVQCRIGTLEGFVCRGYGCDACDLLFYFLLSLFLRNLMISEGVVESLLLS